jgi:DNA-binding transcriptional LysR family regulator
MTLLLEAVDAGSLSAASRRLHIPLATVSRRISDLEDYLKIQLLIRGSRKLALTDAGRSYVAACRLIVESIGEAERHAAGEYGAPKGELVISAPVSFSRSHLLPLVADFLTAYPDIKVQMSQTDRAVNLLEENVDLAVRLAALPDSSLIAIRVGSIRRVLCASARYLERRGTPQIPEDLTAHDCIASEATHSHDWRFTKSGAIYDVPINYRLSVTTAETAMDAALAHAGIAHLMSYHAAQYLANGQLQVVLAEFEPPLRPLSLVYPSQRQVPLKLRAFLDFATPRLRETLGYRASDR